MARSGVRKQGLYLASSSAIFMGMMPVFGKQAIQAGMLPLAVVAFRTFGAASLLFAVVLLARRRMLYIYPIGLAGCLLAGGLNGIGSLLYYTGLAHLDAGVAQLLFAFYPVFVALVLYIDGQRQGRLTLLRLLLSLPALFLLTHAAGADLDLKAAACVVAASALYALHIPINQRVLYEAPAPTVTLYTLLAMAAVVTPTWIVLAAPIHLPPAQASAPVLALTAVTFFSRLCLFGSVKHIGGMQTSLLGLGELIVALILSHILLAERLSPEQWAGACLLTAILLLAGLDQGRPATQHGRGWLHWLRPPLPAESLEPLHTPTSEP